MRVVRGAASQDSVGWCVCLFLRGSKMRRNYFPDLKKKNVTAAPSVPDAAPHATSRGRSGAASHAHQQRQGKCKVPLLWTFVAGSRGGVVVGFGAPVQGQNTPNSNWRRCRIFATCAAKLWPRQGLRSRDHADAAGLPAG